MIGARALVGLVLLAPACGPCGGEVAPAPEATSPPVDTLPPPADRTRLPEYAVARVEPGAITVDGVGADPGWASTAWSERLVAPGDGTYVAGAPVNGAFKLAFDDRALYAIVRVDDAHAESPNARDAVDPHIWASASGIEIMLQPGNHGDNRGYYELQVDTAEAVWDTRFDDYNAPIVGDETNRTFGHQEWSAALDREVTVTAGAGYLVELALPWASLAGARAPAPPPPGATWRANVYTFRDGQRHALAWSPILGEGNFHRASRFGLIIFDPPSSGSNP